MAKSNSYLLWRGCCEQIGVRQLKANVVISVIGKRQSITDAEFLRKEI